jgi:hypothetical protein
MATQKTVWFSERDPSKWFETQTKAKEYDLGYGVTEVIMTTGLNEEASKKAAKAVTATYILTPKP